MKTFKTNISPSPASLHQYLIERLNPMFRSKTQKDVIIHITLKEDESIEIGQPDLYDSFLYKMIVVGNDIQLIKSEHYVDDVYNLALEDIVLALIETYIGEDNLEAIEGEISG